MWWCSIFYWVYIPTAQLEYALHFDHSGGSAPTTYVELASPGHSAFLSPRQPYQVYIELVMPESKLNYECGMFMTTLSLTQTRDAAVAEAGGMQWAAAIGKTDASSRSSGGGGGGGDGGGGSSAALFAGQLRARAPTQATDAPAASGAPPSFIPGAHSSSNSGGGSGGSGGGRARIARASVLSYRSTLLHWIRTLVLAGPLLLGFISETQTVTVPLFDRLLDNATLPYRWASGKPNATSNRSNMREVADGVLLLSETGGGTILC